MKKTGGRKSRDTLPLSTHPRQYLILCLLYVCRGDRALITRREDNLRLEGEFVRKVPDKWEPGQRAAIIRQKDNLQPPGPVEDNRDHGPRPTVGDRAPMVRPGDNLRPASGEFEKRTAAEWTSGERVQAIRQSDHLRLEGEMR